MRILFTTQPGAGHFNPLVPFAHALAAAGHDVAVACAASFVPDVDAARLRAFPSGIDWRIDRLEGRRIVAGFFMATSSIWR